MTCPIERGIVTSWDRMEAVWRHIFESELRVNPAEHNVLLTRPPLAPAASRERATEVMLETFNVRGMHIYTSGVLALYATGRTTGVTLESGDGVTYAVPIWEGYDVPPAARRMDMAGRDLTEHMTQMLQSTRGCVFSTPGERAIVRDVKEKLSYVALDFDAEMRKAASGTGVETAYELPDGMLMSVGVERFRCPEALFQPGIAGHRWEGIHKMVFDSVQACDIDMRKDIFKNVVLAGGSTMFPGFAERLTRELTAIAPASQEVKVIAPPDRKYMAWIGGSIVASLSTFQSMWITKEEYDESGPSVVHRKCF